MTREFIEAMQNSPSGTIKGWAAAIGKSRSSTLSALSRLRDAGRAENVEGHWRAIEEAAPPRELAQPWIRPVRGGDRAAEHHLTKQPRAGSRPPREAWNSSSNFDALPCVSII